MTSGGVVVRATVLRWYADDFPGWIEVAVVDSRRREHRILEKAPVLTSSAIASNVAFPFELWLHAKMTAIEEDEVRVVLDHEVETVDGARELVMASKDVVWL